ncbi:MAG: matrixin family metalloprotease [Pyrinomonadaceae bacterium]
MRFVASLLLLCIACLAPAQSLSASALALGGDKPARDMRWKRSVVKIAISATMVEQNSNITFGTDVVAVLRRSLAAWESVADVRFEVSVSRLTDVSPSGEAGDGISLLTIAQTPPNIVLFGKEGSDASARTRIFYNARDQITEADIVLNPFRLFSTDGNFGTFDLESTLTHEIGHLLGLDHSPIMGSTMYMSYGRNGVYNLANFHARTLSSDDIVAVQRLYGTPVDAESHFGSITGRLLSEPGSREAENVLLWAEDSATGRVVSRTRSDSHGSFEFRGLTHGKYNVFYRLQGAGSTESVSYELGRVTVEDSEAVFPAKKIEGSNNDIELKYLGFNGQLAELPVMVNPGRSYTLYIGGKNLDPSRLNIGFSSKGISLVPGSTSVRDFGDSIDVLSFEVEIGPQIVLGEYSLYVVTANAERKYILGGITVENFENIWSSRLVEDNGSWVK